MFKCRTSALVLVILFSAAALAGPGSWKRVGKEGAWAGTIVGTSLGGKIYTVEESGALYVTDPKTGAWKKLGKSAFGDTRFMFGDGSNLYTIERSGNLYKVNPSNGGWKQVGKAGAWVGTIVGTSMNGKVYTVEKSGALYVTDPKTGSWKQLGKPAFGDTRFMFAGGGKLYTIEKSGNLYQVDPSSGAWKQVGKSGAWQATIAGTALQGKIYTVESSGSLYRTEPASGKWQQLGKADFAATRFIFPVGSKLYTIEKSGSLYAVEVN